MKQNILIGLLSIIVILLSIKVISPTVITAKKTMPSAVSDTSGKEAVTETTEESNTIRLEKEEISSSSDYGVKRENFQKNMRTERESAQKLEVPRTADFYAKENNNDTPPIPKFQPIVKVIPEPENQRSLQKNLPPQSNFEKSIAVCKPYSEKMSAEYMGMLVDYELYIRGWVNNKCVIDFISNVKGVGQSFGKTYNTNPDDVQIFTFAPIVTF